MGTKSNVLANGRQEAYGAVVGGRYADLGAERQRDWVQEYIYRLINERFEGKSWRRKR